jgi:hypothetical protein
MQIKKILPKATFPVIALAASTISFIGARAGSSDCTNGYIECITACDESYPQDSDAYMWCASDCDGALADCESQYC